MERVRRIIKRILEMLASNDLTETGQHRALAEEYAACCEDFNRRIAEVENLMARDMFSEAGDRIAELNEQAALFNFPGRDVFLDMFRVYQWPPPPALQDAALPDMMQRLAGFDMLKPLLMQYRVIARSEDIAAKVHLLRRLLRLSPEKAEWKRALGEGETALFNQLAAKAKAAIIAGDFVALADIDGELSSPDWVVKPNSLVADKVRRILDEHNLRELEKESVLRLEAIASAYSGFDAAALDKAMEAWWTFLNQTGFNPDFSSQAQVEEANEYLAERKRLAEKEAEFKELLGRISEAVDKSRPLMEVVQMHLEAERMELPIPEKLEQRYLAFKNAMEDIQHRRRIIKRTTIIASVLVLVAANVFIGYNMVMNYKTGTWRRQLCQSLENEPLENSLNLLEQLKASEPELLNRPQIADLSARIAVRKAEQDGKLDQFNQLADKIDAEMSDFATNVDSIEHMLAAAGKLAVDQASRVRYKDMLTEYEKKNAILLKRNDNSYVDALMKVRDFTSAFQMALADNDFEKCNTVLDEADRLLIEANKITHISAAAAEKGRIMAADLIAFRAGIEGKRQEVLEHDGLIADIESSGSLSSLTEAVEAYLKVFPLSTESSDYRNILQHELNPASALMAHPTTNRAGQFDPGIPAPLVGDLRRLSECSGMQDELRKNAATKLALMTAADKTMAVVMKQDDMVYDYYFKEVSAPAITLGSYRYWLPCIIDNAGNTREVIFEYLGLSPQTAEVEVTPGVLTEMKLLYPRTFTGDNIMPLAPHVVAMEALQEKLEDVDQDPEQAIVDSLRSVLKDEAVNPSLKLAWVETLLSVFPKDYPGDDMWRKNAEKKAAAIRAMIPSDYNWWVSYEGANREMRRKLAREIGKIDFNHCIADSGFDRKLLVAALSRGLTPVGFIRKKADGNIVTVLSSDKPEGELWILNPTNDGFMIVGSFSGDKGAVIDENVMFPYPIRTLYSPSDGKSTAALTAKIITEAKAAGIEKIQWPASWPQK
ncbi:MAG: hypothetical protein AB7F40_11875 [Victivallaceae bacterium]|nr:hypothetical protein [Victivallaceae bacterium]